MWYVIEGSESCNTPGLIIYLDRVRNNINRMIAAVGDLDRLCPHVKTHKMSNITRLYMQAGVWQFKCATIAEAEMLATCHAKFVLLAFQPVGPAIKRLVRLVEQFPETRFATIVDNEFSLGQLAQAFQAAGREISLYLDIDNGMHRSGIQVERGAEELYQLAARTAGLTVLGLHVYDGHIRNVELAEREQAANTALQPVYRLADAIEKRRLPRPKLVVGGTPTFAVHAKYQDRICSPGTSVFWDHGYGQRFPELGFEHAAVLITRVISKVSPHAVCLDLGYKAIAAESPPPRAKFLDLGDVKEVVHSEEHLVLELQGQEELHVGDLLYAIPKHICPTVALYQQVHVVENRAITGAWPVDARDRVLTI